VSREVPALVNEVTRILSAIENGDPLAAQFVVSPNPELPALPGQDPASMIALPRARAGGRQQLHVREPVRQGSVKDGLETGIVAEAGRTEDEYAEGHPTSVSSADGRDHVGSEGICRAYRG
jgi:hypothetical protein